MSASFTWLRCLGPARSVIASRPVVPTLTVGRDKFFCCLLQPGSELDNLEEILDDLQNSQLPQLFPDTRPGAPAGSVDKQAIINDLMQLTAENSPVTPVGAQKTALRISQSSEYEILMVMPYNHHKKQGLLKSDANSLVTSRFLWSNSTIY